MGNFICCHEILDTIDIDDIIDFSDKDEEIEPYTRLEKINDFLR